MLLDEFQSTLPARGATAGDDLTPPDECHFNPRSPHGERLAQGYQINPTTIFQSTLPARGATLSKLIVGPAPEFQSTLPARGATTAKLKMLDSELFQSTLPARGATRALNVGLAVGSISIHAPRTGSDRCRRRTTPLPQYFNPRSPHGERRLQRDYHGALDLISIHAPRTGSDDCYYSYATRKLYFNPRSPHGERRNAAARCRRA